MTEIFTIADRYTVLRNGQMVGTGNICDTTPTDVTRLMVGNSYSDSDIYESRDLGENILELENYSGNGFANVNLAIRRGEELVINIDPEKPLAKDARLLVICNPERLGKLR